jgi:hypothetical protein
MKAIANQFQEKISKSPKKRIAVLLFRYQDGKVSSGSAMLSEQLDADLSRIKGARVADRRVVRKKLFSSTIVETGELSPETIQKMGVVLEVDLIVRGELQEIEKMETLVSAKLYRTDTGEEIASAKTNVKRTWSDTPQYPGSPVP